MTQLVCSRGHVSEIDYEPDAQERAIIAPCPKGVNGPNGKQVPCGCRATWKRTRAEIKT